MSFMQIDLRRTYLIARRDFLGYVKTIGFWVSLLLPMIFGIGIVALDLMNIDLDPVRYETILDETGRHESGILKFDALKRKTEIGYILKAYLSALPIAAEKKQFIEQTYDETGLEAAKAEMERALPGSTSQLSLPPVKRHFVGAPADNMKAIAPYLLQEKMLDTGAAQVPLDGVLHIFAAPNKDGKLTDKAEYWSVNINNKDVKNLAQNYFKMLAEDNYLASGGLTPGGLAEAKAAVAKVDFFDPRKSSSDEKGEKVSWTDRIPFFVGIGLTFFLWINVFSGSYLLLTSMLEEKLNKLLEAMLASARFSEIIFGKLLGVGAMTLAAMLPYIVIGALGLVYLMVAGDPKIITGLAEAFTPKLMFFFFLFLVLGYVFYGALFIAVGSLAESMQDAQTITTPIMLVLTGALVVVIQGAQSPDSALIKFASWFPLSAPFASILRLHLDPPWWELALSALFLFMLTVGVVWLAGRMFRYGVFSGGGTKALKAWFSRHVLRRKPVSDS